MAGLARHRGRPRGSALVRGLLASLGSSRRWQWWAAFLAFFAASLAWLATTPLLGSADEPAHVLYAAAAVRGQLLTPRGPIDHRGTTAAIVHLPGDLGRLAAPVPCFAHHAAITADCRSLFDHRPVARQFTLAGRYPPAYYLIVGLPSLVDTGPSVVYLMRLVTALLCCALLASAVVTAAEWSPRLMVPAVAAAATPMALFVFGAVNPSGLEISAAIGAWVHGLRLVRGPGPVHRRVVVRAAVAMSALAVARPISPLWLLLILLVVAGLAPLPRLAALLRRRDVRVAAGVVLLAVLSTVVWVRVAGSLDLIHSRIGRYDTAAAKFRVVVHRQPGLIRWMIAGVGWADVPIPALTMYAWKVLVGLFVGLALLAGGWRGRVAVAATLVGSFAVPMVVEASKLNEFGPWWQGRYTLPFAVGIVLVSGAVATRWESAAPLRWVPALVAVVVTAGHLAVLYSGLRRWSVGAPLRDQLHATVHWWPPLGPAGTLALWTLTAVLLVGVFTVLGRGRPMADRPRAHAAVAGMGAVSGDAPFADPVEGVDLVGGRGEVDRPGQTALAQQVGGHDALVPCAGEVFRAGPAVGAPGEVGGGPGRHAGQ
jgi:hypothetical protein